MMGLDSAMPARIRRRLERAFLDAKTRLLLRDLRKPGTPVKLELGSGPVRGGDGWVTMDSMPGADLRWDLRRPLPFPDNRVSQIYTSHLLEHFEFKDTVRLLRECWRILEPGGTISVCVPDASIYIRAYTGGEWPEGKASTDFLTHGPALLSDSPLDIVNYIAYMDGHHKHMFDAKSLLAALTAAGFGDAQVRPFQPGRDLEERRHESIYARATKG